MQSNEKLKNNIINESLKYPFHGKEKRLIDNILILGYDYSTIKRKILTKEMKTDFNQISYNEIEQLFSEDKKKIKLQNYESNYNLFSFHLEEKPIILNNISNDYSKSLSNNEIIVDIIFPKIPKCYMNKKYNLKIENKFKSPKPYYIIFQDNSKNNLQSKKQFNCIAFIFYQKIEITIEEINWIHFIPFSFCFISEFPYFYSFYLLANQIKNLFDKKITDIPLELIIYNLIDYIPSPINQIVTLNIINKRGNENFENCFGKKKLEKNNDIEFPILSGYPLIQYNLINVLFLTFSSHLLIEIFIWTFLEKNIIFFSNNIEHLNLLIYSLNSLNYPLNDDQYYWMNSNISIDNLINISLYKDKKLNSILGVCDSYEPEKLKKILNLEEYIFIDIEKGKIFYSNKKNIMIKIIKKLCRNRMVNENKINYLSLGIKALYLKLEKFKIQLKQEKKFDFLEYDNNIEENNKEIQEAFYIFLMTISLYFYQNINYLQVDDKLFNCKNDLIEEEKKFIAEIKETKKYKSYFQKFIYSDLYKIPLSFYEEFLIINYHIIHNKNNFSFKYFDIIDSFYFSNPKKIIIDLNIFYNNFNKEKKRKFIRHLAQSNWELKNNQKNNVLIENKSFKYYYFELSNEIIMKYVYYLNNLTSEEKLNLFPQIKKKENNEIQKFEFTRLENLILDKLIELKIISRFDLLCYSIIIIFIISITLLNDYDYKYFLSLLLYCYSNPQFFIFRKYYVILLNILYSLINNTEEKKDKKNKVQLINFYFLFINIITENNIIPNETLITIIRNFSEIISFDKEKENFYEFKKEIESFIFNQKKTYSFINQNKDSKIGDFLNIKILNENKEYQCVLIDILILFKMLSQIIDDYIQNFDEEKLDKLIINQCIINLIFYIEKEKIFEEKKNDVITCLIILLSELNKF